MNRALYLILLLLGWASLGAQGYPQLSDQAEVHLLTGSPGAELYSSFGHSAIRIVDAPQKLDRIYNYGTFNFATPNFYLKFMRGQLPYYLSLGRPSSFVRSYAAEQRAVIGQVLNLNPQETQGVFEYLENNLKPENREYPYDFFFDNCATRERDLVNDIFGDRLDWQAWSDDSLGSIRELLDLYLAEKSWENFGIDLILGIPCDQKATMDVSMFLPDFLYYGFQRAKIKDDNGWKPLVNREYMMVKPPVVFQAEDGFFTPSRAFWLGLLVVLLISAFLPAKSIAFRTLDWLLFTALGLGGLLVLLLWVATDHDATKLNMNAFWLHPGYLIFAFIRLFAGPTRQFNWARYQLVMLALFWLVSIFLPQGYNGALLPFVLIIAVRLLHVVSAYQDE